MGGGIQEWWYVLKVNGISSIVKKQNDYFLHVDNQSKNNDNEWAIWIKTAVTN